MEILSASITETIKFLIPPLGIQVGYLLHCKRNLENLINELKALGTVRIGVDRLVETAQGKGVLIKSVVEAWLVNVDDVQDKARELNDEAQEINRWFKGWCCSRYYLGKESKLKIGIGNKLIDEGRSFNSNNISDPAPLPSIEDLPIGDFEDFASRESVKKQIIEALKDDKIYKVGVFGMGGVGKTTLMKEIAKKVKRDHLFNEVVMITVSENPITMSDDPINASENPKTKSKNPDPLLKKIQDDIADNLGMKLEMLGKTVRASRLSTILKNKKRILLIFDGLWKQLDLADVGIPLGEDKKDCKVIITTRSQDVCNQIDAQVKIKVEVLSKEESWDLFVHKAGSVVDSHSMKQLARKVANECGGLPLALVTLGRSLRDKDNYVWVDTLKKLEKSDCKAMYPVLDLIKLSYHYLGHEEIKKCFLFCSFFPENWNIKEEDLMWYVIGENPLQNSVTLDEARGGLHTLIDKLIASCLLLEGNGDRCVKMHDIVRDAALSIVYEESMGFIVKVGLGLKIWPERENLRTCKRMSLMMNNINELPEKPECPELLTLSLFKNPLDKILDSFFEMMTSLVTLNLEYTQILSLPPSLSCLTNLQTLCLNSTPLRDISVVTKLKKVEILSLSETHIESFPEQMKSLTNLKFLDLSNNRYLRTIPPNVLSYFSQLEELYMQDSFRWWGIEGMGDGKMARLNELASLKYFTNLCLDAVDAKCFSKEISPCWEYLGKFSINVGSVLSWNKPYQHERVMSITNISYPLSNWIKDLLKRTDALFLCYCEGLNNVIKLDAEGFVNLKYLRIEKCFEEMEYLVSVLEEGRMVERVLQITTPTRLRQLNSFDVTSSFLPPPIFQNLIHLRIGWCDRMKHLFPMKLVRGLQQLQVLEVDYCHTMQKIIVNDSGEEEVDKMVLPQLKTLGFILSTQSLKFL